jgi:hypothetical protein
MCRQFSPEVLKKVFTFASVGDDALRAVAVGRGAWAAGAVRRLSL